MGNRLKDNTFVLHILENTFKKPDFMTIIHCPFPQFFSVFFVPWNDKVKLDSDVDDEDGSSSSDNSFTDTSNGSTARLRHLEYSGRQDAYDSYLLIKILSFYSSEAFY